MKSNSKLIYHYCSIEAFLSIIQNSKLWLSDVCKSNDAKEYTWIMEAINKKVEAQLKDNFKYLDSWKSGYEMGLHSNEIGQLIIHAACFSECDDLLSQWRGYAQNGTGVAIGFSKANLQLLNGVFPYNLIFEKVVYKEKLQGQFINDIYEECIYKMQHKGIGITALELHEDYQSTYQ